MQVVFIGCSNTGNITVIGNDTESHASGIGSAQYSNGPWLVAVDCKNTGAITITGGSSENSYAGAIFAYGPYMTIDNCDNSGVITVKAKNGDTPAQKSELIGHVYHELYLNEYGGFTPDSLMGKPGSADDVIPQPQRPDYTFVGWYDNKEFTGELYPMDQQVFGPDKTFYPSWTTNTYTVEFDPNGVSGEAMSSKSFTYDKTDEALPANAYTREHYWLEYESRWLRQGL